MTIIRNVVTNPSVETGLTGWVLAYGTMIRSSGFPMAGMVGDYYIQAEADGSSPILSLYGIKTPVVAGDVVGMSIWLATAPPMLARISISWLDAAGTTLGVAATDYAEAPYFQGARRQLVGTAPAGAVSAEFSVRGYSGSASALPAGRRLWVDALVAVVGASTPEVLAALSGGYHDGDDPGWVWEGVPHASPSHGPALPYTPDGELFDPFGDRVAWLDLIDGFEVQAESRTTIAPVRIPGSEHVTMMRALPGSGTLKFHFTRELADGTPAERAAALEASLRIGTRHSITFNMDGDIGPSGFGFYPTGRLVRRLEHAPRRRGGRRSVWTVEVDFSEAPA